MFRPWTACALLLALSAPAASGEPLSISCDSGPGGLSSLVVEGDGVRVSATETEAGVVIEAADPGAALDGGSLRCAPARAVQVVPGRLLGLPITRVLVTFGRERPRIVRADGRVRLLWLPDSAQRAAPAPPAIASAPPARPAPAEPARVAARPEPAPAPARVDERPTAPAPAPRPEPAAPARSVPPGAPPDYLGLDRPVTMVASVETELREGPGRRFARVSGLEPGARIEIDGRAGDWIRTTSGRWAFGPYFEAPEEALSGGAFLARIDAINAPVHAGPAAHHEIVAELYRGEQVVVDEVKSEWAHVRDGGWVRMSEISRAEQR